MHHGVEVSRLDAMDHGAEVLAAPNVDSDVAVAKKHRRHRSWRRARRHGSRRRAKVKTLPAASSALLTQRPRRHRAPPLPRRPPRAPPLLRPPPRAMPLPRPGAPGRGCPRPPPPVPRPSQRLPPALPAAAPGRPAAVFGRSGIFFFFS